MSKQEKKISFSSLVAWLVGILVSLAVGSGMINKVLTIPFVPAIITQVTGGIVIAGVLLSLLSALFEK